MGAVVAGPAEPDKVVEPVRVGAAPSGDVMHLGHRGTEAVFAAALAAVVHLPAALRVDRVALPTPVGDGLHSSVRMARFSS